MDGLHAIVGRFMSMISPHRTASTRWAAGMQNARAIAPRLRRRCSARPRVPDVPHDQARWDGSGAVDLPLDRRGARWTVMGHGQRAARCYLSVHAACAPGEPVVTQRRCRRRGEFAFCAPCLHSLRRNSDAIGVKRTSGGGVRGVVVVVVVVLFFYAGVWPLLGHRAPSNN